MKSLSIALRLTFLSMVVALYACAGVSPIKEEEGKTLYTQVNLWAEGGEHITTNYRAGLLLPINSQVKILDTNAEVIKIQVQGESRTIQIVNEPGYSGKDIKGIYNRYFGPEKVDLSGFSSSVQDAIQNGVVKKGMSRDAVLLARGHPPAHKTPSLDMKTWTFWRNRFARQTVTFTDGEVSELEGF